MLFSETGSLVTASASGESGCERDFPGRILSMAVGDFANPSPVFFTIRPRCSSIFGSTSSRRWAWSRSCVPLAHQPRVTGYIRGKDRGEAAGLGHDRVGPLVEVGDRLCSPIVTAGYRWIKSQAWIPDFDTCEPLASLE